MKFGYYDFYMFFIGDLCSLCEFVDILCVSDGLFSDSEFSDIPEVASDHSVTSNEDIEIDNYSRFIALSFKQADSVCIKLNELMRRGKIDKSKILCKFLSDVVEIFFDPHHPYDPDVVEFFNTISYLGGRRTYSFVWGPMFSGMRGQARNVNDCQLNLGGPSEDTILQRQSEYTTKLGVLKDLSLAQLKLGTKQGSSIPKPLVDNEKLLLIGSSLACDGTPLKPSIRYDNRMKVNVGLTMAIDVDYMKLHPTPSKEELEKSIVTEALVSSVITTDNTCSMPCGAVYCSKSGKAGEEIKRQYIEQIKILQMCQACQQRCRSDSHIITSDQIQLCDSTCQNCIDLRSVCYPCQDLGYTSYIPSICAC